MWSQKILRKLSILLPFSKNITHKYICISFQSARSTVLLSYLMVSLLFAKLVASLFPTLYLSLPTSHHDYEHCKDARSIAVDVVVVVFVVFVVTDGAVQSCSQGSTLK